MSGFSRMLMKERKSNNMDRNLYDAAASGNVHSLHESLRRDPAIVDRIVASCVPETPLHVAALRGHVEFAKELLEEKPQLAHQRNCEGLLPLHLASAKGDVEMVRLLLRFVLDISRDRDREGRTPVHAAAMKGRADVLKEFIRIDGNWVGDVTGRGETVLHLCVKYDHIETLKMLVREVADEEFVNQKDENGNTVLHLASAMKHIPIIKFLLCETPVEVNAMNANSITALDVLSLYPSQPGDMEIGDILRRKGAKRAWELPPTRIHEESYIHQPTPPKSPTQQTHRRNPLHEDEKWKQQMRKAIMVVATLNASVTFQAGLSPPGGFWPDDSKQSAGISILYSKNRPLYHSFIFSNSIAFFLSLGAIIMSVTDVDQDPKKFVVYLVFLPLGLSALVPAYICGVLAGHETSRLFLKQTPILVFYEAIVAGMIFGMIFLEVLKKRGVRVRPKLDGYALRRMLRRTSGSNRDEVVSSPL